MSESNLAVKITAETTDLATKLAMAQSSMRAFNAEARSLADQMRVGGDAARSSLMPQLATSAGAAARARSEVASLREEMGEAAHSFNAASLATSGVTRELLVLGHEAAMGNFKRFGGSIMVLAERMGGLKLSTLGWGAAIAAAGFAAFELVKSWREVEEAEKGASAAFAIAGINESRTQIDQWIATVRSMPGATTEAAGKVVREMARLRDETPAMKTALIGFLPELSKGWGVDLPEAAKKLVDAIADLGREGKKMLTEMGAAPATLNSFNTAIDKGDRLGALSIVLGQVATATNRVGEATKQTTSYAEQMAAALAGEADPSFAARMDEVSAAVERQSKAYKESLVSAAQANPTTKQQTGVPVEQVRLELETIRQDTSKTNAQILADELAVLRQRIAGYEKLGQDASELKREEARLVSEQNRAISSQAVAQAREANSAIAGDTAKSAIERLQAERSALQQLLAGEKLTGDARLEVQRQVNEKSAEIAREAQSEKREIARSDADADLEISRLSLAAKRNALDVELQANRITAAQKLAIMRGLADQEFQLDMRALESELANLKTQPVEYERVYNQIRILKAKHDEEMAALDRQATLDAKKEAKEQSLAWKGVVSEIESAESGLVRNVFSGRMTLNQMLLQMGSEFLQRELAADLQYMTRRLLLGRTEAAADQALQHGGILTHLLAEGTKTTATATGEAARTGATAAGSASRLAIQAGEMAEGLAMSAATAIKDIAIKAYQAAAGAWAAISGIPYVGPFLAPAMAAAALAGVIGLGTKIASAEGGMWSVPGNMMANIHKDESVIPASIANPMRDFFTGGNGGGAAGGDVHFHVAAMDGASVARFFRQNGPAIAASLKDQSRNFNPNLRG